MGRIGESWAPLRPKLVPKSLVVPSGRAVAKELLYGALGSGLCRAAEADGTSACVVKRLSRHWSAGSQSRSQVTAEPDDDVSSSIRAAYHSHWLIRGLYPP
jgi:hypothetical protein